MPALQRGALTGLAVLVALGWVPAPSGTPVPGARAVPERAGPTWDGPVADVAPRDALAAWVVRTRDHGGQPFFIVDKTSATLHAFDRRGRWRASTPVLLGLARGDDSVPGIGDRPIAAILPAERTTPAGRFVAEAGRNHTGEDIVWIDHGAAVSMHRVRTHNAQEQRARRLATPTAEDNRISYGCINVPVAFYDERVQPVFAAARRAVVYVLPETRSLRAQFGTAVLAARDSAPGS